VGVRAIFSSERFGENRGTNEAGKKIFSLSDAYPYADLVTYPSLIDKSLPKVFIENLT